MRDQKIEFIRIYAEWRAAVLCDKPFVMRGY